MESFLHALPAYEQQMQGALHDILTQNGLSLSKEKPPDGKPPGGVEEEATVTGDLTCRC